MSKVTNYFNEVIAEMKKVSWPKRDELMSNTVLTLVFALVISLFIFGVDRIISQILDFIYA